MWKPGERRQITPSATQHLVGLDRYVRLGEETSARVTTDADPSSAAVPAELKGRRRS